MHYPCQRTGLFRGLCGCFFDGLFCIIGLAMIMSVAIFGIIDNQIHIIIAMFLN